MLDQPRSVIALGRAIALAFDSRGRMLRREGLGRGGVDRRLAELRESELPHVIEAARYLATCDHLAEFDYGLDLLITALELQLPAS